jgi:beta-glucosidase
MVTIAGSDSDADKAAEERAFQFHNGVFFEPVFKGTYPEAFMNTLGDRMPEIEEGDMAIISQKLDWWGMNYYTPMRVADDSREGVEFPAVKSAPFVSQTVTDIGWEVYAPALKYGIEELYRRYDLPEMYITENGACYNMGPNDDGVVDDQPRIDYLAAHLKATAELIKGGYPIRGYFAWSLMDNFEWAEGYRMRFGIVHVDYETQVRTVKKSGEWFKALATAPLKADDMAA